MDEVRAVKPAGLAASLVATGVVAWMDYATGPEFGFSAFYLVPVLVAAWYAPMPLALGVALFNALVWSVVDGLTGPSHPRLFFQVWEGISLALVYLALGSAVASLRRSLAREQALNLELNRALEEVGELKGLLPVCAWCHKVRDDHGYWGELEAYVEAHTQASFTHGICPDCQAKVMAERSGFSGEHSVPPVTPPPRSPSS